MNSSYYKHCIVPHCRSTSINTPTKLFIRSPSNPKMRKKWLKLARREDASSLSTVSRMYFCEDHFDLPNDMANYMQYHIMGTVTQVHMKPGCLPSKFECREEGKKRRCTERPPVKKQTIEISIPGSSLDEKNSVTNSDHSGDDGGSEDDLLYDSSRKSKGAVHSVPKTPCSLCRKSITGFVFVCVQCNVRACGTCDARGLHAKHFVLRAPSGSTQNDLNLVLGKIRDALQSSGFVRAPDTRSDNREGSDADNEEEFEVKTEIKLEIDVEEQDPLLESAEYDELFAPGAGAARGSQVVPEQEIKSEPPDTSSPVSLSTDIASSRRQSAESAGSASDSDSQPLAKRKRIDQGQPTASPKPSPLRSKDIEKPDKEILYSDPNTDPGSPSAAGAITRLKE
ncbi:uncharacterized protein LOC114358229 isoform X1 [Ostrinia furnacalis]|uniref:uncharacterized protein LOC114358229 isoform X1 n=1 Tax=Ostrinia furnacalis TaxID=93504 RepID=UPI00103FE7FA|nr:uncharacterized protein LOC114358229 isoform X1 [Ostrinia furnacalis]XP_028167915.1 uncharacterized protein LOC114358229 isoform X1 [Ostrinia furnacalis]